MIGSVLKDVFNDWWEDDAPRLGASLAYYTLFSLAPLLIIAVSVAGLLFGREAALSQVVAQIRGLIGHGGAQAVEAMIESARKPRSGTISRRLTKRRFQYTSSAFNTCRASSPP